jgi:hypothetical protein
VFVEMLGCIRIKIEQTAPAAPDADDFVAFVGGAIDGGFDAWVESGDISAPGEYSDVH